MALQGTANFSHSVHAGGYETRESAFQHVLLRDPEITAALPRVHDTVLETTVRRLLSPNRSTSHPRR